jgi:hypothetical protein
MRGQVADRGLGLHLDVVLVVVDLEHRLRAVVDAPDHHGADLDRVAALVVDLQRRGVEVAAAQRDLALAVERVGPAQAFGAVGTGVLAEQQHDGRLARLQHVQAGEQHGPQHDQADAQGHGQRRADRQHDKAQRRAGDQRQARQCGQVAVHRHSRERPLVGAYSGLSPGAGQGCSHGASSTGSVAIKVISL